MEYTFLYLKGYLVVAGRNTIRSDCASGAPLKVVFFQVYFDSGL